MKKLPVPPRAMMSVQRHISALREQIGFPTWWEPLHQAACNGVTFLSREWLETWLEMYGARYEGKWVWWSCDGQVVGGCLLLIKPIRIGGLFFRTLFLNATGFTPVRSPLAECNDILYVAGFDDAIANDLTALLSEMEWKRLVLVACSSGGIISRVVTAVPSIQADIEQKPAPYINFLELPDAPFARQLTSNTRSQIQRCRRIYESTGGPITITSAPNLETAMQYFEDMAQMHNARWSLKGLTGSFSNPLAIAFHRKLIGRLWSCGAVDLVCVKAGEMTVGFLYNFIALGKVYFYQSGFAYQQNNNKLKPGLLTHSLAIENYRVRGLREYDFLVGDSQYKRSIATHERFLFCGTIYRNSGAVRLLLHAKKCKALLQKYRAKLKITFLGVIR